MLRFWLSVLFLFIPCSLFWFDGQSACTAEVPETVTTAEVEACAILYRSMDLEGVVSWKAFRQAVAGYHKIGNRKRDILTLIDFSRPSTEKRLFVFDMRQRKMLFSSVVSHGKNSGENYATSFSNEYGSYKSSLGFYLTESTYQGKNGYSLILDGLEKGINDRARERAIVMHGAAYANPSVVSKGGRLGRSFGCPAVPQALARPIIDTIKGGSVMYIYAEAPSYFAQSTVLDYDVNQSL
ncbi:murein L,D-transpeptidase catalytic domain family protein [Bacteroides sp.]|uniref:murein L,D-transpeptidase catalytic domain family protein n=1 Tax=Bacteroides sp. TaxID=29523 RepID=UPI00261EBABF|nr:murein L,D-transpeptidase catalytic domain family protein [Bacteroides sp.]